LTVVELADRAASVRIGGYALDVRGSGSFAKYESAPERESASALERALKADGDEQDDRPKAVAAIEEFEETADEVTGKIEQADKLLEAARSGQLLNLSNLTGEIDSLLELFGRLDRAGRFEEEFRLMRSLNGLLALGLRWLELIRSLRSLLKSAETADHAAGKAFAHHELGSLYLCAGHPEQALEHLQEAARLQERIGIPSGGQCATRHNLDSAQRDLALEAAPAFQPPRRIQRLIVLAGAIAVAAGGGAGIALAVHGGRGHHSTPPPPPPPPSATHKLTVQLAGRGTGSVTGGGLSCPNKCSVRIRKDRTITVKATHANGSVFTRWSRAACGTGETCKVTMTRALTVTATFSPVPHVGNQLLSPPTGLRAAVVSGNEVDLSWLKPSGNATVVGYVIYRDQRKLATVPGTTTIYQDASVQPATSYLYSVQALGARGNASLQSASAKAATPAPTDTQPPTQPTGLQATATSTSEVDLSWTASTDNVGVSGYIIYRDGTNVATVPGTFTTYADTGLAYGSFYTYTVQAIDAAGNSSTESSPAKAATRPG
jgi:chitodextrinase/tetratricopeptide (TPR) repeat protein